ncbi:MAG: tetratricopeptide repeat protein [Bacteroidales bacterium]
MSRTRIAAITLALMVVASAVFAQDFKGNGRLSGKVVDEQGKGLEAVVVTATYPEVVGAKLQVATDKSGAWVIEGVAEGNWELVFEREMYKPGKASVDVDESGRTGNIKTVLKKNFDPNEFIQEEGKKAEAMMAQKNYAGARAAYEGIIAKVPEVTIQMQPFLARAYYMEGNHAKAAEHLKIGLAKDSGNQTMRLMLVDIQLEAGATDEAAQTMQGIDEGKLTDPALYVNFGVALLKKQKTVESLAYFDKAIKRFPKVGESYYYRANALANLVNEQKDPKDPERIKRVGQIKSDLTKFIELSPNSPEAPTAKKMLEEVEKQVQK